MLLQFAVCDFILTLFLSFFIFFNRYFHLRKYILASAVSITMASLYIFHTCPIPSWSMHVMSRSNYIIELDAMCSSSCTLHPNGLCWARSRSYQVWEWNCLIIVSHENKNLTWFLIKPFSIMLRAFKHGRNLCNSSSVFADLVVLWAQSRRFPDSEKTLKNIDVKFSNYFLAFHIFSVRYFSFPFWNRRAWVGSVGGRAGSFTSAHHRARVVLSAKAHHM